MWKVPLFDLDYGIEEKNAINKVIDEKWLTSGPRVKEFEKMFSEYHGKHIKSLAVSNCTVALYMALLALNINEGDEVLISGLSFIAALNAVYFVKARPILVDSTSMTDWNCNVEELKRKINTKTKAVIVVHFAGYPCKIREIANICKENSIALIEDVAHAIGAEYEGEKCGTFGDFGCFSFFSNKNLSTGEGGMIVTKDEELYKKISYLRSHGMTTLTLDRHLGRAISYDVIIPGLNFRLDEIRGVLGIEQLKKLDINNEKRRKLVNRYIQRLCNYRKILIPFIEVEEFIASSYHIFCILLDSTINRNNVIQGLTDRGIQSSIHYPSYREFTAYKETLTEKIEVAEYISSHELTLPLYPTMTMEQVDYVCESLIEIINIA